MSNTCLTHVNDDGYYGSFASMWLDLPLHFADISQRETTPAHRDGLARECEQNV